jgi:hypothetical protein
VSEYICPNCKHGHVTHLERRTHSDRGDDYNGSVWCSIRVDGLVCCSHLLPDAALTTLANTPEVEALAPSPAPSLAGGYEARKAMPMLDGLIGYFPNACAYVSHVSFRANEQHNPGEPMHWAANKSIGTGNEIVRHLAERGSADTDGLLHTGKAAWRALELLERELLEADPTLKPGINVRNYTRASASQKAEK